MPRKTTRPAATAAGPDSAGITVRVAAEMDTRTINLAELAPHPHNPRQQLANLDELAASIKANNLFEPLVVLTASAFAAAAEAEGDPERPGDGIAYITLMGHRRAAAAGLAGLAEVPAVVRDDLAGRRGRAAMIAENLHREDLAPLEEARQMADLAACGWSQRQIAEEVGCGQAHVSKRLSLLQLPEPAREALAGGAITTATALELHGLYGNGGRDAISEAIITGAVDNLGAGDDPRRVIKEAKGDLQRQRTEQATREQLAKDGITIVTETEISRHGWQRLYVDVADHGKAGCLAAKIDWNGEPGWICTQPASHRRTPGAKFAKQQADEQEFERETRKAAKARDAACQQLATGKLPPARELLHALTLVALGLGGGHADTLSMAWRWLNGSGTIEASGDHYQARDQIIAAGDRAALQRFAFAYALATDEVHVRARYHTWGDRHIAHLERLTAATGYTPTPWEARLVAEAQAVADARGTLTCPQCGCSDGRECQITYDREQQQPVYRCASWGCTTHQEAERAAAADGRDAFFDAIEDAVYVLDPTRGHDLPGALDTAGADLAEAFAQQDGAGPLGKLTAAAAAVTTTARGCPDLPGEVTTALAALQAVLPGQEKPAADEDEPADE